MIKKAVTVISDFSGGQDTKTPIISMGLNKSPNMRNYHCAGVKERLLKRSGFAKVNSSGVESDNLDCFYPPGYQTTDYAIRDASAQTQISQGFKPNTSSTVTKVKLWLKKVGTPAGTDTITLVIQTNSSGVPSGTAVTNGTSVAVDISDTLTTSYAWVTFTFTTNPSLTAGTQYHLVLQGAFTIGVNYVQWGTDNFDVIYPDGTMAVYDGTTWTAETLYDACFEVYITNGAKGNDGVAVYDFSSKNMLLGIWGTSLYKMDKNSAGTPDGVWDAVGGGSTWDTYTKLMLHCDGADGATTFTDEIGKVVTANGNCQIDTAQSKFGGASGLFDGTGDYLTVPDHADFYLSADFTIDFQLRFAAMSTTAKTILVLQMIDADNYMVILGDYDAGGVASIEFRVYVVGVLTVQVVKTYAFSNNTWYHISVNRSGGNYFVSVDGVGTTTADADGPGNYTGVLSIGGGASMPLSGVALNGWIDEFRVSKGIARWTANFTAPTSAYSASALPLTSSRYWTFADWQSGRALINTDIGMYTYTGSGNASTVSAAPLGKFLIVWRNYAFVFGIRGSPNNGQYSALSDYTSWPAANTFSNAFNTNDGDVIIGVRILKGRMYVFKRYAIFRVTHLGSNPTFQVDQILGIGCPSHYTIKEVDMGGEIGTVLIFPTIDKKLAIFTGYNIQIISDVLSEETNDLFAAADDQPLSFADINYTYADLFHAVVKSDTYEYILYCVLGSDTAVNYAFVFDYKVGGIFPYDNQIFASSCYLMSTNKAKLLYCAGYTGYLWLQESGNNDDGSAINTYVVTGKIIQANAPALLNKGLLVGVNVKEVTSVSELTFNFQFRLNYDVSWSTAESVVYSHNDELTFGRTNIFDISTIFNMLQIKLKDNSSQLPSTIYSIILHGDPVPLGNSREDGATV